MATIRLDSTIPYAQQLPQLRRKRKLTLEAKSGYTHHNKKWNGRLYVCRETSLSLQTLHLPANTRFSAGMRVVVWFAQLSAPVPIKGTCLSRVIPEYHFIDPATGYYETSVYGK
jgi:hypothetical protein